MVCTEWRCQVTCFDMAGVDSGAGRGVRLGVREVRDSSGWGVA